MVPVKLADGALISRPWLFITPARSLLTTGAISAPADAADHGPVVRADQQWLLDQGVQPWMGERSLPLWLVDPDWLGFNARDSSKARRVGLTTRPLEQTLADTLSWELTRPTDRPRRAGLTDNDESALLAVSNSGRSPPASA